MSRLHIHIHVNQKGAVLFVSLVMLIVITLLVLTSMNSSINEERMASNFRQRDLAFQNASTALRWGEFWLLSRSTHPTVSDCAVPACANGSQAWNPAVLGSLRDKQEVWWEEKAREYGYLYEAWGSSPSSTNHDIPGVEKEPRYVIEEYKKILAGSGLSSPPKVSNYVFVYRISASGKGEREAGSAIVQSYYARRFGSN